MWICLFLSSFTSLLMFRSGQPSGGLTPFVFISPRAIIWAAMDAGAEVSFATAPTTA